MQQYRFVGHGLGVPGLPHVISDEEAEQLWVVELLKAAVENGNYETVSDQPAVPQGDDISDEQPVRGSESEKATEEIPAPDSSQTSGDVKRKRGKE
jgi:hypothetical protein